jgi:hypothetical protein
MSWTKYVAVGLVAAGLSVMTVATPRAGESAAPGQDQPAVGDTQVEPQAGLFAWTGTFVRGKSVRTYTTPTVLAEGAWRRVSGAVLSRTVAAGTSDLFNVSFSAECQVRSTGTGDAARIRIAHYINGFLTAPIEPYDGDQRFCSSVNPVATHKGNWAQRVGAGVHTLYVEVLTTDFFPDNGAISTVIDDWTFEVVVYD